MWVTHDYTCTGCKATHADVVHKRGEDPLCPECGATQTMMWGSPVSHSRTADAFAPITYGGVRFSTRSEWDAYCVKEKAHTGEDLRDLARGDSRSQRRTHLEEMYHHAIGDAKRRGRDDLVKHYNDAATRQTRLPRG